MLPIDATPTGPPNAIDARSAIEADGAVSRRFTRVVLGVVAAGLAISAGFAWLVDPLRTFGTGRVPSVLTSEHYSKPRSFLALDPPAQAIVLGSSKVMKLAPSCLHELTGYPAFNFGLSSSHVEDWIAAYRFVRAEGKAPLHELVIGVDVDAFDNHAEPDPRLLSSVYLRRYLDDRWHLSWGVASRALFGWQALRFGLSSLTYHFVPSLRPQARMRFDDQGLVIYDAWEHAMQTGTLNRAPLFAAVAEKLHGKLAGKGFDALSTERAALFQELVRSVIGPLVARFEAAAEIDLPARVIAERIVDMFVREIYGTRRKDVIRLIIAEGPRFPKLAEFYYREVIARVITVVRGLLRRAAERGEIGADALARFPQLLVAPGLVAIVWDGLFDRFEPLDVAALMRAHLDLLFGERRPG